MKSDLEMLINHGWTNAAGTAGYAPVRDFGNKFPEIVLFTTNPVSYSPRSPAKTRGIYSYPGGFLVHTGFPCPGYRKITQKYKRVWETSALPICVNVLSDHPKNIEKIIRTLEGIENIACIELNLEISLKHEEIKDLIDAALGELPMILSIPYEFVLKDWLGDLLKPEISAISIQAPRGIIIRDNEAIRGRLFGESVLPMTMFAINQLTTFQKPIIAGVGALSEDDIKNIYLSGAQNFQAHELIWRNDI